VKLKKIRYAIVGAGWISQEAFMPGVEQTGNSEMTAIVTGDMAKGKKLADFYGIRHVYSYEQYDDFLKAGVADAVYIALPNSMHADYSIRASKAGLHSLVEKPLAVSREECEAMIAAAEASKVWLMTAYRLHNEPATVEALEMIRRGDIGDPRIFTATLAFNIPTGNHRLLAKHWGGALQDIGVYCLNAARHVFQSEPEAVAAMEGWGNNDPRFKEMPETVSVTLMFPGGRIANFHSSFGTGMTEYYRVSGSKGELMLEQAFRFDVGRTIRLTVGDVVTTKAFQHVDNFSGMTAYFSDCILRNERPEADGEDGLADVVIMRAIEEAARTGKTQKISLPAKLRYPVPDMVRSFPHATRQLLV
jgi:predicted dehydrogenase